MRRAILVTAAVLFAPMGTAALAQSGSPPAIVAVCAPCHGSDGMTGTVVTPNLAGQKSIYLREQLLAFRKGARRHPDMKAVASGLSDREIDQLVSYYATLVP